MMRYAPNTPTFSSIPSVRPITAAVLAIALLAGCAGGVRNGAKGNAGGPAPPQAPATATASTTAMSSDGTEFVWKGEGGTVAVAGEFNAWNTSADPLAKQADGSWKLVKKLPPGRYAYKFVIDGGTWKEDPAARETIDDGFGGKNAVIVVGGTPGASTDASVGAVITPAAPAGKGKAPAVVADGVVFVFAGAGGSVHLAGEFNAWSTSADPLVKQADGTWMITKKLASGTYGYKFVVDGSTWKTDEANPEGKDDGFGGKNSIVVVP